MRLFGCNDGMAGQLFRSLVARYKKGSFQGGALRSQALHGDPYLRVRFFSLPYFHFSGK